MSLNWIDPALEEKSEEKTKSIIEPQGKTECQNCGRELDFKYIYFDYCKYCVHEAH